MDLDRQKRQEGIQNALVFIQSLLPYPEPECYKGFLTQLVCNLLDEGNAMFREGEVQQAIKDFSEGVNVAHYAQAESVEIPSALLESLYVDRAAAYHSMRAYEQGVQDCDSALALCKDSCRALYRKALCLRELGRFREAYNCSTGCLLITPNDKHVYELAQELVNKLGLKIRKAYISTQDESATSEQSNGNTVPSAGEMYGSGLGSLSDISSVGFSCKPLSVAIPVSDESSPPPSGPLVYSKLLGSSVQAPWGLPFSVPESEHLGDSELMGGDLDSLLDCIDEEPEVTAIPPQRAFPTILPSSACVPIQLPVPSGLPAPSPRLPPAFFNSAISQLNSLDTFPGMGGRDALGALDSLDALNNLDTLSGLGGGDAPAPTTSLDSLDALDALDSFSTLGGAIAAKPVVVGGGRLDSLSEFNLPGARISHNVLSATRSPKRSNHTVVKNGQVSSKISLLTKNPLAATHDFKQACARCYSWKGPGVLDYLHQAELAHRCKRDILLCRIRASEHPVWNRVRPRPMQNFNGPFMLCKEVLETQKCKYGEGCTFAYCQEELNVWTLERKGALNREFLFDPQSSNSDRPTLSITCLLQLHSGMFMYLCEECYDSKPRIVSKRSKEVPSVCSNLSARHPFDQKKCLVHAVRSSSVHYTKIRPLDTQCQLDVCRHARRYCCQRGDSCSFAHSVIELKCWMLQLDSGITHEEIVQESKRHWHKRELVDYKPVYVTPPSSSSSGGGGGGGDTCRGGGGGYSLNLKRKFVCGQCWKDGLVSEPDKAHKYCAAKARHSWTKDRRVLLVKSFEGKKWVMVRPLPFAKTYPQQYDICAHVVKQKKCHYIGNCAFAHSEEEKQVWTYMKNNGLKDMQQMYDMWLTMTNQNRQPDDTLITQPIEEKQIVMPTDYAEPMSGVHCRLCGKYSNSERQWRQHISSEKHKDRVFSCEGEDESLTWTYRFPGFRLALCPRLESGCPEGVSCDYAHSDEELVEWQERQDFLRRKLAKARDDKLIMPDELDFGKYNFLLQD